MKSALILTALFALPASMAAAGAFNPPAGCTTWMTVQSKSCKVSNYYKCSADPAGDQWRADFGQQGIFFVSRIDHEAQWIESYELNPTVRQSLDPNPEDPASFTELMGGVDTFAFNLSRDDGSSSSVTGFDRLTGKSVVIDGITLQETEFTYEETRDDGSVSRSRGNEYVHPEWRNFFSGPSEWDGGDGYLPMDSTPVQFIFPGESGFESIEPIYECDAVLSEASPLERLYRAAD